MLSEELWKPELVVGMEFMKNMQQSAVLDLFRHMPQVTYLLARKGEEKKEREWLKGRETKEGEERRKGEGGGRRDRK